MLTFMSLWIGQQLRCFANAHLSGRQNKRLLIWSLLNVEQYLKDTLHG